MGFKPKYYPYPVLAPFTDDYKSFSFEPNIKIIENVEEKALLASVAIESLPTGIESAIADGVASLVVDVDCPATLYRRLLPVQASLVALDRTKLLGDFSLTPLILLNENVVFKPSPADEVDDVYAGVSGFQLRAADPLAIGDSQSFSATFNARRGNSLISLVKDSNKRDNLFAIDTSGESLTIRVSAQSYAAYAKLVNSSDKRPAFVMGVVKDAIFMGISTMVEQGQHSEAWDLPWARAIRDRLSSDQETKLLGFDGLTDFDFTWAHGVAQEIVQGQGIDLLISEGE